MKLSAFPNFADLKPAAPASDMSAATGPFTEPDARVDHPGSSDGPTAFAAIFGGLANPGAAVREVAHGGPNEMSGPCPLSGPDGSGREILRGGPVANG
ncbi:MAG: hypothetical protein ACREF9_02835, partial [Opitutaceae bacterium]